MRRGLAGKFALAMTPARPGPDARLVGRGRVRAFIGFACLGALSVAGFTDHSADGYLAGIVLVLGAVFGWSVVLWARVWVDGDVLYARKLGGWDVPLRLDRLTHAELGSRLRPSPAPDRRRSPPQAGPVEPAPGAALRGAGRIHRPRGPDR